MSGQAQRRFWQLHLSTAVILMLTAGVIVGWLIQYAHTPIRIADADKLTPGQLRSDIMQFRAAIALDILLLSICAAVLLASIALLLEWLIRRREASQK